MCLIMGVLSFSQDAGFIALSKGGTPQSPHHPHTRVPMHPIAVEMSSAEDFKRFIAFPTAHLFGGVRGSVYVT